MLSLLHLEGGVLTLAVNKVLEKDSLLVQQEGKYQGKLIIPYGYGVVFTNISCKSPTFSRLWTCSKSIWHGV
jgi:hypothetical protein